MLKCLHGSVYNPGVGVGGHIEERPSKFEDFREIDVMFKSALGYKSGDEMDSTDEKPIGENLVHIPFKRL
jgi:hypothetical protein